MNIVKRKSVDVGKGLKSSACMRLQDPGHDIVNQPIAKFADDDSSDKPITESKKLRLDTTESSLSHSSASTLVVNGLESTVPHSVNSSVENEPVLYANSASLPCVLQQTSHSVASNISETAVITSSSAVKPKVTEVLNRRIQHLVFSAGPVTSAETVASVTEIDHRQTVAAVKQQTSTNHTLSSQLNTITDGVYLLWPNENSLCWLDVTMALMVNCESLRGILTQMGSDSCLNRLLMSFDRAQVNFRQSRKLHRCHYLCGQGKAVTLETSVGQVTVKTGGGRGPPATSQLCGASSVIASVDLDDISTIVNADNPHSTSVDKVSREAKRLEDKAKQLLTQTRDEVFQSLQPRMHCKRGECDSVVIALAEILSLHDAVKSHFTVRYTYLLSCCCCGHHESGM